MTWYSVADTDLIHWSTKSSFEQVVDGSMDECDTLVLPCIVGDVVLVQSNIPDGHDDVLVERFCACLSTIKL